MTQPELGTRNDDYVDLDIDQLAETYLLFVEAVSAAQKQITALQYEFHIRMKEEGDVEALPSGKYEIKMVRRTARYDTEKLKTDLEGVIDTLEISQMFHPEWLKPMPETVDGRRALKIKTKYRGKVEKIINNARTDTPYLKIEVKEELN